MSRAGGSRKVPVRYTESPRRSPQLSAAISAHRKGMVSDAQEKYEQRLRDEPSCLDAVMNLGALYVQAGRATEAAEAFGHAATLAPADGRVFRDIGVGLRAIGRLAEAVTALEHSVACAPELVGSWLHLARVRLDAAPRALAVEAARRAVQLRPQDPSALFILARCTFDADAPEEALEALALASHCPAPYPEAAIFRWLLECRRPQASRQQCEDDFARLAPVTRSRPHLSALADAVAYIQRDMAEARLFSSARDTLRFALGQAPSQGSVVELGVFHGVSLRWLAERRPGAVHGFDSFVGLPSDWASVPEGMFTTAGRTPEAIDATLWVGPFAEQLPQFVASQPAPIALLHIDSDLYESARCGLDHLGALLGPGSVVVFDEYLGHSSWRQDEFRAFQEAALQNAWGYDHLAVNPFTGQAVLRLREA